MHSILVQLVILLQFIGDTQSYPKGWIMFIFTASNYWKKFLKLYFPSKAEVEHIKWVMYLDYYGCIMIYWMLEPYKIFFKYFNTKLLLSVKSIGAFKEFHNISLCARKDIERVYISTCKHSNNSNAHCPLHVQKCFKICARCMIFLFFLFLSHCKKFKTAKSSTFANYIKKKKHVLEM